MQIYSINSVFPADISIIKKKKHKKTPSALDEGMVAANPEAHNGGLT